MARLCLFLIAAFLVTQGQCKSVTQSLSEYVSAKTQPFLVPQTDPSQPIWVDFQMGPYDIEDVDKQKNVVTSRFWFAFFWNSTITWTPSDYNGLQRVGLPGLTSFRPNVLALEIVEAYPTTPFKAIHWFNGMTGVYVTGKWKTLCSEAKDDKCTITVLSSDYPNNVINLRPKSDQMFDFSKMMQKYSFQSSNYKLVSESFSKGTKSYKGIPGVYDTLSYTFSFKKRRSDDGPLAVFRWR